MTVLQASFVQRVNSVQVNWWAHRIVVMVTIIQTKEQSAACTAQQGVCAWVPHSLRHLSAHVAPIVQP